MLAARPASLAALWAPHVKIQLFSFFPSIGMNVMLYLDFLTVSTAQTQITETQCFLINERQTKQIDCRSGKDLKVTEFTLENLLKSLPESEIRMSIFLAVTL